MLQTFKSNIRAYANTHIPNKEPNVFIFSTPRSGSTWLMELIRTQPGFKSCEEPLNLRNPEVRHQLGLIEWSQIYGSGSYAKMNTYFEGFCNGSRRFMNGNPLTTHHRFMTNRIVFKVLHGGEDRLNWFAKQFNGSIVLLLRHPLAVSVSREIFPRLTTYISSDFRKHLTDEQLQQSIQIIERGTHLEKGVLSWCLQNMVALRHFRKDWVILTYEQMVLEPAPMIQHLANKLELPYLELMMARMQQPSASSRKSDRETRALLDSRMAHKQQKVIGKWRKKVDEAEGKAAMKITDTFGLDIYRWEDDLPSNQYWVGAKA